MQVERACYVKGRGYVLFIKTDKKIMQVYVSEKGQKIEAYPPYDRPKSL